MLFSFAQNFGDSFAQTIRQFSSSSTTNAAGDAADKATF
jgi:hypothetical protein